ncbi:MAG: cytochrome c oxidase subunit I [Acidimicrobiales bacterium]|jgi:cytochrome c oxidase subunit 1|nr:cytochrome c oxidase subunit I [Acidimicrobiales bacterium]MDP6280392.1 cytochrome c oxidase subunit I [Acidimicrobiales bacterium]MDP7116822.1 cytochrome c oxidase subunit I [Acidimicrobiales bacterium]MDP7411529.1 cytochrome c oxidase subunit I [Acidimicrobiales bacterium]MEE1522469.1 cytochrome c oxidase subunit I [Acidimicrobiales bacterium]|tara:strand:- start:4598 stop:6541 length:1944 start_codon:yes stop_codon:yes gene_type:complete
MTATTTVEDVVGQPLGVYTRPRGGNGWRDWITTVDHKKIGILYGVAALFFFVVGGIEALLIRLQLATPNGTVLGADMYNQVFTMHGVTMIFLAAMPLSAAFANYLIPLQIGARDVALPRLNALSFWVFLAGGIVLNLSWVLGGAPDGGWFGYAPNTGIVFSPSPGMDFYALGLQMTGIASLVSSINLTVTILNMRAPGMTLFRMPVFTWMILVTQLLLVFAMPVIAVALFLLAFSRLFGARFFDPSVGGDALLWQHLFWIFGHPEVYILILPSFGIISEVIPTFSRKPIFGYPFMVFSGIAIGFMGWGVWAHHMFVSGIGPISVAAFSLSTMFIAVPTGVKILNWMATMWGGRIKFSAPMLFAVGVVSMFTIGGLSGVTHAISPADTQQTDTYYIVAHFHYVIFGGIIFGLFAGLYFWWPKVFGHQLSDLIGKVNFWVMLVGFNLTFGPMHVLGLQGMARRIDSYSPGFGFEFWNMVSTIGSFLIALSIAIFVVNVIRSAMKAKGQPPCGPDPWDARSLEWLTPNPTPVHDFDEIPVVESLDEFWHRKYGTDENGRVVRVASAEEVCQDGSAVGVHLPSPSFWPIVFAAGLPFIALGLIFNLWLTVPGGLLVVMAIYAWVFEPVDDPDAAHGDVSEVADTTEEAPVV